MSTYDWSRFSKKIPVRTSVQKIYDVWTTQSNLEKWFLRKAEFTKPDQSLRDRNSQIQVMDTYLWMWHGYGDEVFGKGEVLQTNGHDLLQFTFANCLVTVKVSQEGVNPVVELMQENIPLDEENKARLHVGCLEGWTFYLANLKSILEGGLDLRNKDENVKGVVNS